MAFAFGTSASTHTFSKDVTPCDTTTTCDWYTSVSSNDPDNDGLSSADEVSLYGTDPNDAAGVGIGIEADAAVTGNVIEKIRYCVPHDGLTWEVDVFQGSLAGMVLAEVELARADQSFAKPAWLGEEVTGDLRFRQSTLLHLCCEAGRPITMDDVLRLPVAA